MSVPLGSWESSDTPHDMERDASRVVMVSLIKRKVLAWIMKGERERKKNIEGKDFKVN